MSNKPHRHAEVIKAWADGATIECKPNCRPWLTKWAELKETPQWHEDHEYRIKPEPPAKVYPVTGMTNAELCGLWDRSPTSGATSIKMAFIANATLRHAIDSGQLVEPPKPGSVIELIDGTEYHAALKRNAARDMAIAFAVQGACQEVIWKQEKKYRALHRTYINLALEDIIATVKD